MSSFAGFENFARAFRKALLQPVIPVIWAVMSIFCVVSGPFGTSDLSLLGRFIFWPTTIGFGILVGAILRVIVRDYFGYRNFWPEAPLIAFFATALLTPVLTALSQLLALHERFTPAPHEIAAYVVLVSFATSALRHAVAATWPKVDEKSRPGAERPGPTADAPQSRAAVEPSSRLMARLPPELRAPLVRLQMRDHYVEVITDAGAELLLLRMADAICAAEGVEGLQVHRSHWVALRAIRGVVRQRGRVGLQMSDGAVVPVSRANVAGVLALGLPEVFAIAGAMEDEAEATAAQ